MSNRITASAPVAVYPARRITSDPNDAPRPTSPLVILSARESEIAKFVADGHSNKEIGQMLRISHHTVSTHLRRIFTKLDVGCRIELCRIVISHQRLGEPTPVS